MTIKICRVLVVENDADIRTMLGDVFAYEGYRFAMAQNDREMRRILGEDDAVDVVVIDVNLPGTQGLALAEEVADRGYGVILVTGDHRHFDQLEKCGHGYLFKPFPTTSLLQMVDGVLTRTKRNCARPEGPAPCAAST